MCSISMDFLFKNGIQLVSADKDNVSVLYKCVCYLPPNP